MRVAPTSGAPADAIRVKTAASEALNAETRRELDALVRTAVQQALAPVVREHRELEEQLHREVRDLRAQLERVSTGGATETASTTLRTTSALASKAEGGSVTGAASVLTAESARAGAGVAVTTLATPAVATQALAVQNEPPSPVLAAAIPSAQGPQAATALDRDLDVSWVTSGTRRRRTVSWIVGIAALLAVGGMALMAILSQMGFKI